MGAKVPLEQYQRGEQARGKSAPRFHGNPPDRLGADVPPPSISRGGRDPRSAPRPPASPLPPSANDPVVGPATARPEAPRARGRAGDGQATTGPTFSSASLEAKDEPISEAVVIAGRAVEQRSGNTTADRSELRKQRREAAKNKRNVRIATVLARACGASFATQEQIEAINQAVAETGVVVTDMKLAIKRGLLSEPPHTWMRVVLEARKLAAARQSGVRRQA
jgi:hypothetical protein